MEQKVIEQQEISKSLQRSIYSQRIDTLKTHNDQQQIETNKKTLQDLASKIANFTTVRETKTKLDAILKGEHGNWDGDELEVKKEERKVKMEGLEDKY